MASAMTVAAQTVQVPNTWDSAAPWQDSDLTVAWDKHWDSEAHKLVPATTAQGANWMADLPDNMFVAHVSIPGAHDFASGEEWESTTGPGCSTTQAATMKEQLDLGIRALDFRPGLVSGEVYCNHGTDQTKIKLADAMSMLNEFLTAHPQEFFIIHLFRGNVYASKPDGLAAAIAKYKESDKKEYNEKVGAIFNNGIIRERIIDFSPNLKVGDVRGKIVLLRRDRINFLDLPKAGYLENWTEEFDPNNPGTVYNASNKGLSTTIHMQDVSSGDNDKVWAKQGYSTALIEMVQTQQPPNEAIAGGADSYKCWWALNFTSIENSGSSLPTDNTNGYKGGASLMNPYMLTLLTGIDGEGNKVSEPILGKGPIGIYYSDYVIRRTTKKHGVGEDYRYLVRGDELVYKIIENNFTGEEEAPVVRFALDDNDIWDKEYSNPYDGKRVYFRHKTTGQWLCGGANYGSHLALDDHGYYFTMSLDQTTGKVTLVMPGPDAAKNKVEANPYFWVDHPTATQFKLQTGKQPNTCVLTFEYDGENKAATVCDYAPMGDTPNPYWDNLKYYVDPKEYVYGDPRQEFEIVSYEERVADLEKANPDRPYSATFMIPAYSFGNGWTGESGVWTFDRPGYLATGNSSNGKQYYDANGAYWKMWNTKSTSGYGKRARFTMEMTISGLPAGKYKADFQGLGRGSANTKYQFGNTAAQSIQQYDTELKDVSHTETGANATVGELFKAGKGYTVVDNIIVGDDGKLTIKFFNSEGNQSETSSYIDNIHLTYYGPENKAEEIVQVNFPEHWNTVILPFDVSESYISSNVNKDGKDYIFYQVDKEKGGYKETSKELQENQYKPYYYHVVQLSDAVSSLKANTPYIVENLKVEEVEPKPEEIGTETQSAFAAPARAAATDNTYLETFVGHPTNYEDTYTDAGNFLTGVLADNHIVGEGHYPLVKANYQMFAQLTDAQTAPVAKYHAYVHSGAETAEHPIILFKDVDNVLTGVEDVAAEEQDLTDETHVDVYTTGGILVRSQVAKADALTDLPRGIYILAAPQGALKVAK